jgi:alpha-amylase
MKWKWLLLSTLVLGCKLMPKEKQENSTETTTTMNKGFQRVDWRHTTNIYEVNLRQYTKEGTFAAFSKEIPRLKDMGVQVLWFMPITPIATVGRKGSLGSYYACSDYKAANPEYGSVADFKQLVDSAHAHNMKVIIDWVANHTGNDHVWMKTNADFYNRDSTGAIIHPMGWDDVSDLNFDNTKVQEAMIDAMQFWVKECNIDGFRCDMAHLVPLAFWRKARTAIDATKQCFWLAECEEAPYMEVFDALYSWEWMHKSEAYCKGKYKVEDLWNNLYKYNFEFDPNCSHTFFTSNHDENSWNGTDQEKYGDALMAFNVFSCTWNGIPMLYSGQELPNKKRLAFFDKDPIEWTGKYEWHDFYKTLLNLHATHPALRAADPAVRTRHVHTNMDDKIMAYERVNGNKAVLVMLNLTKDKQSFSLQNDPVQGDYKNVFGGNQQSFVAGQQLELPAWGYLVLEK